MERMTGEQQEGMANLERTEVGDGGDEEPSLFDAKKYWEDFNVSSERTIEHVAAVRVERDFQEILRLTLECGGNSTGCYLDPLNHVEAGAKNCASRCGNLPSGRVGQPTGELPARAGLPRPKLRAVDTPGDGNCLLNALSISASGATDHGEVLRKELKKAFQDESKESSLFQAYKEGQVRRVMGIFPAEIINIDFGQMWRGYGETKRAATKSEDEFYAFHVFVMAQILRRPIIVYGESAPCATGDSGFPGLYLPTLCPEDTCTKTPLAVAYSLCYGGRFIGIVGTAQSLRNLPLVYNDGKDLPIRFGVPATSPRSLAANSVLFKYMEVSIRGDWNVVEEPLQPTAETSAVSTSSAVEQTPPSVPRRTGLLAALTANGRLPNMNRNAFRLGRRGR